MKVTHGFVDQQGHTHFDDFDVPYPLLMDDVSADYFIIINSPSNAGLLADRFRAMTNESNPRRLLVCCPGEFRANDWEDLRMRVRHMCVDLPSPAAGGFRAAENVDYYTARVSTVMRPAVESARKTGSLSIELAVGPDFLATISGHPVWRRCSWPFLFNPAQFAFMLCRIHDPTWLLDAERPRLLRGLKSRMGLHIDSSDDSLFNVLSGTFFAAVQAVKHAQSSPEHKEAAEKSGFFTNLLEKPEGYFLRYGLRWFKHYLRHREDPSIAMRLAAHHFVYKLGTFLCLAWLDVIYPEGKWLDIDKFFENDGYTADAARQAYYA